ncbi:putative secreted protein (Por secretion system target) [Dyadobacter jejuensis]|uniref:Putative secreted protein (Por secretion system target) n=2 Tax=Dyadobacter jejuensis TaxID=1082580 RepID=A0A316AML3_9BACT|nr:putative secreted protein (Por secretion system target) [Dyadobacter jejuensis]
MGFLGLASITLARSQPAHEPIQRCATADRDALLYAANPGLLQRRLEGERALERYLKGSSTRSFRKAATELITIPVVVHVVYNSQDVGNNPGSGAADDGNLLDSQIQEQIAVLNEDYGNLSGIQTYYSDSLGVDTQIRFKLVEIRRTYSEKADFDPRRDGPVLAAISPARPTNQFLNIWVCKLSLGYLGGSQFPVVTEATGNTQGLDLADDTDNPDIDGVMVDYRYFGRSGPTINSQLYNLGRTATHEVGHWLGLIHIWGDTSCGTDYCDDTPQAQTFNQLKVPNCQPVFSTCQRITTRNMTDNYMDYSPDRCMGLFTADQAARMHAVLALSPRRAQMVAFANRSDEHLSVTIAPNPVTEYLNAAIYAPNYSDFTVNIYSNNGKLLLQNLRNQSRISLKNFASGVYLMKVSTNTETVTKRFLIP